MGNTSHDLKTTKPNVVLIFMDDMTHWALRSRVVDTPNLDRLTASGTQFTHAFNQGSLGAAVCVPARQMLLTGLSLFHADERFLEVELLGDVLTGAGYSTYFTGKWHNEESALYRGYDEVGPWAGGMLGSEETDGEAYSRPCQDDRWDPSDTSRGGHWMKVGDGVQHSSERWTDAAVGFLRRDHGASPFFLHLAYHAPHDPRQAPRSFLERYIASDIPLPPNMWPEHPFDNGDLLVRDELLAPFPRTSESGRLHRQEYFAMISHADEQIGRVLDEVQRIGGANETLIVFSGDHGLALGEHGLMGKQNPYDHSIRVPLVVAGPGVPRGRRVDSLVYAASIFPTVCELVGVSVPESVQFPSLVPELTTRGGGGEKLIFGAYRDVQRLVRSETYKLVWYPSIDRIQLFNLDQDEWEMHDLSGDPDYAGVVAELSKELALLQAELDDPLDRIKPKEVG